MPIDSVYVPPPYAARAVTVADYGAVGDGVTDDSEAFRKAAAAAHGAGAVVELDAKRYALYSCVDLSGLHALQWRGRGHASVVVLRGPTSESAFCATGTDDLAFRSFDFDGSLQAPVAPTDLGGYGIDVQGGTTLDLQDLRAYRTNRAILRATGTGDVACRRIGLIELAYQQPDRALNCDTMGLRIGECARIELAGIWGRDFPQRNTQLIRISPLTVDGGVAATDVTIRGVRLFRFGQLGPPGKYGGAGITVMGYPSQNNLARRVTITDFVATDTPDSIIWAQAVDVAISQFALERTGGMEVQCQSLKVSNGVLRACHTAPLWIHTNFYDPRAATTDPYGPGTITDVAISNVLCDDASYSHFGGVLIDNGQAAAGGVIANIQLDNLTVRKTHRAGILLRNVTGTLQLGRVVLEDTCRSSETATCTVAAPGTDGTSGTVPLSSSAGFTTGDWFSVAGVPYRPLGGARILAVPDATHVTLCNDAGDPIVAGVWAAGATFTADFQGRGALEIQNDAGLQPVMAHAADLVVRETASPAITPRPISLDAFLVPLHARLTTSGLVGANAASQALNGSRLVPLPGSTGTLAPLSSRFGAALVDDLAGGTVTSGQVGAWGWNHGNVAGGSGGGALTKGSVLGRPGVAIVDPAAGAANVYALYTGNWYHSDEDATWEFLLAMMIVDANSLCRAGVCTLPVGASPPASGWWIERDYAGGAWILKTSNGGSTSQQSVGVTPTNGGYALLRVRRAGGTIFGSVSGSAEVSLATNIMAAAGVGPFVHAGQNNGTPGHTVRVDRVGVEFPSLIRY